MFNQSESFISGSSLTVLRPYPRMAAQTGKTGSEPKRKRHESRKSLSPQPISLKTIGSFLNPTVGLISRATAWFAFANVPSKFPGALKRSPCQTWSLRAAVASNGLTVLNALREALTFASRK